MWIVDLLDPEDEGILLIRNVSNIESPHEFPVVSVNAG